MITLGVNGNFTSDWAAPDHDASAALVADGVVLAAVEEERLARIKRAPGHAPLRAACEVLSIAGCRAEDVDVLAYPWLPEPRGQTRSYVSEQIRSALRSALPGIPGNAPVEFVPHHVAHAFSGLAYVPPGVRAEDTAIIALDGCGESTSGALFRWGENGLIKDWNLGFRDSLGAFYEGLTTVCGFGLGHEGKTMGLAAYSPDAAELSFHAPEPFVGDLPPLEGGYLALVDYWARRVIAVLGEPKTFIERAAVAGAGQRWLVDQVRRIVAWTDQRVVVLVGGVALNCSMNGALSSWFEQNDRQLVVPPPAGDAGVALGAALAVDSGRLPQPTMTALLGRQFSVRDISRAAQKRGLRIAEFDVNQVADRLCGGSIMGWFDGKAEVGPRALGARCVIAAPNSARIRDRVNLIKGRESWRPLAPSVSIREFQRSFIGSASPYMLKASKVRAGLESLGGVTHVDGSSRPQVVSADGVYLALVRSMGQRSPHEAVLCTSFNSAGQPIVYSPGEALDSALGMGLDAVAGDGWVIEIDGGTQ